MRIDRIDIGVDREDQQGNKDIGFLLTTNDAGGTHQYYLGMNENPLNPGEKPKVTFSAFESVAQGLVDDLWNLGFRSKNRSHEDVAHISTLQTQLSNMRMDLQEKVHKVEDLETVAKGYELRAELLDSRLKKMTARYDEARNIMSSIIREIQVRA